VPNLWSNELSDAIKEAYRKNLPKDSMTLVGVRRYKKALEAKGIDLSGYNTDETVSDIDDLLLSLRIDSVNLVGVSYSGGLMLAVLQRDPARVRSLILDSPLPTFVPIDEDEPANFNEALDVLFRKCEKDSADKERYGNLREKFDRYFTSLGRRMMTIPYVEKGHSDTMYIQYTRNELYDIIIGSLYNRRGIKDAPYLITEIMKGHHQEYMQRYLDGLFSGDGGPSGMRLSVYCADQTAYHEERIRRELNGPYPFMEGYHINDVYREMCDCWQVPSIRRVTKQPFYSDKPALLADGELDPACRPLYIDRIHHYMPNSQRLLGMNRGHGVFYGMAIDGTLQSFLDHPYQKVVSGEPELVVY